MSVPVTEQFLTAERTLAIEGKSIASMGVSEGQLVLTRENAATLSTPLPAGSVGFLGAASFDGSHMSYDTAYGDGTLMTVTRWVDWATHSGGPLGDSVDQPNVVVQDINTVDATISMVDAGWYMANLHAFIEFPNSVPSYIRCIMEENGPELGRGYSSIHPVVPGGEYFETVPTSNIDITTAPFWCDGTAPNTVRPQLWWPTVDATPEGNYTQLGPPNISIPALNFTIYRLA